MKIECKLADRTEILQIAEHYSAKVVDYGVDSLIVRIVGAAEKLDVFLQPAAQLPDRRAGAVGQDPDDPRPGDDLARASADPPQSSAQV